MNINPNELQTTIKVHIFRMYVLVLGIYHKSNCQALFRCLEWALSKLLHRLCVLLKFRCCVVFHISFLLVLFITWCASDCTCPDLAEWSLSQALYSLSRAATMPVTAARIYRKWSYHSCWKLLRVVQAEYLLMCYDIDEGISCVHLFNFLISWSFSILALVFRLVGHYCFQCNGVLFLPICQQVLDECQCCSVGYM